MSRYRRDSDPSIDRKHFLATGAPKKGFETREEAVIARDDLLKKIYRWSIPEVYECHCGKWHVGNKRAGGGRILELDQVRRDCMALEIEIGTRASKVLIAENSGSTHKRRASMIKHLKSAQERRLLRTHVPPDKRLP